MTMNTNPSLNSEQYNALVMRIEALRLTKGEDLSHSITQMLKDANALETLRKQQCRQASTSFTTQAAEFEKRFAKLNEQLEALAALEAQLEAIDAQPKGFGTFVRHIGYQEIEDRRKKIHKYPVIDVRDARGKLAAAGHGGKRCDFCRLPRAGTGAM